MSAFGWRYKGLLVVGFVACMGLVLVGCKKGGDDHAGHDHGAAKEDATAKVDEHAGHDHAAHEDATDAKAAGAEKIAQKTCPVMGGKIDPDISVEYKGQKVYFCCKGCIATFNADPGKYLAKLQAPAEGTDAKPSGTETKTKTD